MIRIGGLLQSFLEQPFINILFQPLSGNFQN